MLFSFDFKVITQRWLVNICSSHYSSYYKEYKTAVKPEILFPYEVDLSLSFIWSHDWVHLTNDE